MKIRKNIGYTATLLILFLSSPHANTVENNYLSCLTKTVKGVDDGTSSVNEIAKKLPAPFCAVECSLLARSLTMKMNETEQMNRTFLLEKELEADYTIRAVKNFRANANASDVASQKETQIKNQTQIATNQANQQAEYVKQIASDTILKASIDQYVSCAEKETRNFDDKLSDANTIARVTRAKCQPALGLLTPQNQTNVQNLMDDALIFIVLRNRAILK